MLPCGHWTQSDGNTDARGGWGVERNTTCYFHWTWNHSQAVRAQAWWLLGAYFPLAGKSEEERICPTNAVNGQFSLLSVNGGVIQHVLGLCFCER
jgi:hypothetical protein